MGRLSPDNRAGLLALGLLLSLGACRNQAGSGTTPPSPPDVAIAPAQATLQSAPAPLSAEPAAPDPRPLGMGLSQVVEWTTQLPFINLVKQARPWTFHEQGRPWGQGRPAPVDEQGWIQSLEPGQRAELIVLIAAKTVPFDRFLVTWKGQGSFRYRGNAQRAGAGPEGFKDLVQLGAPDGQHYFALEISETDPQDPLRDFVIIPEPFLDNWRKNERFNPDWLERLKPFRLLRFMDWMQTNNSRQSTWAERPRVEDLSYRARGVPVEVMIELSNQLGADAWFNLPHLADDAYVRAFAEVVKTELNPQRIAYFEHSNEVWNWMFGQAKYANATGRMMWRDKGVVAAALGELAVGRTKKLDLSVLDKARQAPDLAQVERDIAEYGLQRRLAQVSGTPKNKQDALRYVLSRMLGAAPGNAYMQYNGMRAAQICDVLKKEVFAGVTERVRCVVGVQTANHGLAEPALLCPNWSEAPCVGHGIDTLAITGYVGHNLVTARNAATLRKWAGEGEAGAAKVVAELSGARRLPDPPAPLQWVARDFEFHAGLAKRYGLQLVAYEGGQHIVASGVPELRDDARVLDLLEAANGHPDMGKLYLELLDAWKAAGGGLFVHYVDVSPCSKSGCWGALQRYDQTAPKYEALKTWSLAHPRWW